MTAPTVPPDGHADDLLSAHLDDELDDGTRAWVDGHLGTCPECRAAASALREARSAVRSLPEVDARPVVEGLLARHRRLIRTGAGFVGTASVVLAALGLTAAVSRPQVVPDVAALSAAHVAAAHAELGGMRAVDDAGRTYAAPEGLAGGDSELTRDAVYDGSDLTALVYRDGRVAVSVYEQPGVVGWDGLPPGERGVVGGRTVWMGEGSPTVAVTELGDLVVTVVSEDRDAALAAVAALPERHRSSLWDRLHDTCQRFTQVFALGGT